MAGLEKGRRVNFIDFLYYVFCFILILVSNKSIPENKISALDLPFCKMMVEIADFFFFGNPDFKSFLFEECIMVGFYIPLLFQSQIFHHLFIGGIAPSDATLNKFLKKRFLDKYATRWSYVPPLRL